MAIPITGKTNLHWVDRIVIEIRPLEVDGKLHKLASIKFYPEDSFYEQSEVTAFTLHKDIQVKLTENSEQVTKILIEKEEGKNGGRKKE